MCKLEGLQPTLILISDKQYNYSIKERPTKEHSGSLVDKASNSIVIELDYQTKRMIRKHRLRYWVDLDSKTDTGR